MAIIECIPNVSEGRRADVIERLLRIRNEFVLRHQDMLLRALGVENMPTPTEASAEIKVSADRDFAVYADSEHLAVLPATLRALPRALRVIAPPAEAEA